MHKLNSHSHKPKYIQIKEILQAMIAAGEIPCGAKIPSMNELTKMFQVSTNPCHKAIAELMHEGVLEGRQGKGVFVKAEQAVPHAAEITGKINMLVWKDKELLAHPAFSQTVNGVITSIADYDFDLVFTFYDPLNMSMEEIHGKISNVHAEGIIIPHAPGITEAHLEPLRGCNIPTVFIGVQFPQLSPYSIICGDKDTLGTLVEKIIAQGRKKVALIGFPWEDLYNKTLHALEPKITQAGLNLDEKMIKRCGYNRYDGKAATAELLAEGNIPDVMVVADDYVACGVVETLKEQNIRIPEDIHVVSLGGFLDNLLPSTPWSTVYVPYQEMGVAAGALIMQKINGIEPEREVVYVPSGYRL